MKRIFVGVRTRVGTAAELVRSMWSGPFWWLVPVVLVLLPAAAVIIYLQLVPWVAPFVYTVF
jgi:hypothetical protein